MIKFKGFSSDGRFIEGLDKAVDGLNMVLGHRKKTRAYDYDFGSRLEELLFEPMTSDIEYLVEDIIIDIISKERRFRYVNDSLKITLYPDNTLMEIKFSIIYRGAVVDLLYFRDNLTE